MQFEQPAELNRYVDASIPLTWRFRWQSLKPSLPILLCISVLFVEHVAFRLWLNDRSLLSELPLLLLCSLFPLVLVMLAFEAQVRIGHRMKRKLNLQPKRVLISPAKYNRIRYNQIRAWRLAPIAGAPELTRLSVEYSFDRNGRRAREWSIVFDRGQEHAFLFELEYWRQLGSVAGPVIRLPEPLGPRKPQIKFRSMAAMALGFYCLVHGLPLLGAGLLPADNHSTESQSTSRFTAKEQAKMRATISHHFTSPQAFRKFLLVTGGSLTALGGGLYFWGASTTQCALKASGLPMNGNQSGRRQPHSKTQARFAIGE